MPDIFAFFSFSTPCDPFAFALRFLPSSSTSSAARDFFFPDAPASAFATSSSFSALICASSVVKLRRNQIPNVSERGTRQNNNTYSYFAINAECKSFATYCETRLHAILSRPTVKVVSLGMARLHVDSYAPAGLPSRHPSTRP